MLRYVVRRLLLLVPILLGVSILIFFWIRALPGNPATALLGERATPALVKEYKQRYGLDKPVPVQYWDYLKTTLKGELGTSISSRRAVTYEIKHRFPATVELALAAMLFAIVLGIPFGYFAAKRHAGRIVTRDLDPDLLSRDHPQVPLRDQMARTAERGPRGRAQQRETSDQLLHPRRADRA